MKSQSTIVTGIITLLLMSGLGKQEPQVPSRVDGECEAVLPAPPSPAVDADLKQDANPGSVVPVSAQSAESVPADTRPEVLMYAPESCVICEVLDKEIEKAGGEKTLPFRLVKKPLLDWMTDGPWFYWRSDGSRTDWVRLHGLGKLNGKRLDFLLQEWLETQPEARETVSHGRDGVTVCCCKGTDTQACLCLEEIRKGIKRGPCTCNAKYGSRHFMDANGRPIGPAGGYRELKVQAPFVRLQSRQYSSCPNCRRR